MNYRFLPEARWDLFDAADGYDVQLAGLGQEFSDEVQARIQVIAAQPRLYGRVSPPVRGREVRQALVRRFPYTVVYEVTANEVIIVAVVHVRRSQRVWRRRLSPRQP
jgi:plasmid stabilization system protein ParE